MKPTLYVQKMANSKDYLFDFCYSAMMGAKLMGHRVRPFVEIDDINCKPTNVIVGSVEMCEAWLNDNDYGIPDPISIDPFRTFLKRNSLITHSSNVPVFLDDGPVFVKPAYKMKAFTGFIAEDKLSWDVFSDGYFGFVNVQSVIDIVSEHRVYVTNDKIIGCKHYAGDPLRFPKRHIILQIFETAKRELDHHSYTIDVAVLSNGCTALIELNDGYAIGNYGLEPLDYYLFVRNRWLQITGIRKRKD